jgi:hypothetical protein
MSIVAALVGILLVALLAGADLFLDQYNADELSNMGIQHR